MINIISEFYFKMLTYLIVSIKKAFRLILYFNE
jgi:hypothetical protein